MPVGIVNRPMHIHPHLDIYVNGKKAVVPANVGIDPRMYATHKYDAWIGDMGAAPIHTHDASGTLHVESSVTRRFKLGEFFEIWGFDPKDYRVNVKVTSDGKPVTGDYHKLALKDGEQIRMDLTTR